MGDVINLRMARKAKARGQAAKVAEANRAKFGEARAERDKRRIEKQRADTALDGAKRED